MVTTVWSGLAVGAIYAIIAIGYNITLVTTGILNFAFANIVMLGAYITLTGLGWGWNIGLVLVLAFVIGGLVAVIEERVAVRFLKRGRHAELITTVGAATILTGAMALIWTVNAQRVTLFEEQPMDLLGGLIQPHSIILIGVAVAIAILLTIFNRKTKYGLASLAHAADREATMMRGVNVRWMSIISFGAAGAIGGLLGPLVAMSTSASPYVALTLAVKGFIVLTCGGIGSQLGALIAGLGIGLIEAFTDVWLGQQFGDVAVFVIFVALLLLRPQGMFGTRSRRFV